VLKSVRHWHQIDGGKALAGYSYSGGSALYSAMGLGDEAYSMLREFLNGKSGISILLPNTLYVESGGRNPVLETPLSVASATMELLLQSWGGKIRVFPAVPAEWQEAVFYGLRAQGGFVVSARREGGRTRFVSIRSMSGEPCTVKVPDWGEIPSHLAGRVHAVREVGRGEYEIDLKAGEQITLYVGEAPGELGISPVDRGVRQPHFYGLKAGQRIAVDQSWPVRPAAPAEVPAAAPATAQ
jgi:alpha-L-fucosidase 2